jgi:spore maturation protein CgeB
MNETQLKILIFGLSITSSWGNGHATTYRSLLRALNKRGHNVLFFERNVPWYENNRDLPSPPYAKTILYKDLNDLKENYLDDIHNADMVIVGSYVPQGVEVGNLVLNNAEGLTAFYDIDTPVTLAKLKRNDYEYISPDLIPKYDFYLSFTGGPTLNKIENEFGSPMAKPFYCSFDPEKYYPDKEEFKWDLGYLGTYSPDRQPALQNLFLDAAEKFPDGKFIIAGPNYPPDMVLNSNVERIDHLPPDKHCIFYNSQKFSLNITREDMVKAGYSPSVRLFEAAACATPVISDYWHGIEDFFQPGKEILISNSADDTLQYLKDLSKIERDTIGINARKKVLAYHTADHRAAELIEYYKSAVASKI